MLVRYRCSQYAVQTSSWKMARKLLHKTRWICDFLLRDGMFNKTVRLQLVMAYFCGNLSKLCNVMPRWMTPANISLYLTYQKSGKCTDLASTIRKGDGKKDKTLLVARSYVELGDLDSARSLMATTETEHPHSRDMQNSSTEFRTDCGSVVSSSSAW